MIDRILLALDAKIFRVRLAVVGIFVILAGTAASVIFAAASAALPPVVRIFLGAVAAPVFLLMSLLAFVDAVDPMGEDKKTPPARF